MKINRNGFTLVEILAVFVVIGVLSLITISNVSKMISDSRIKAMREIGIRYIDTFEQQLTNKEYMAKTIADLSQSYTLADGSGIYYISNDVTERTICVIPPVGFYNFISIDDIQLDGEKNLSPWDAHYIGENKSGVVVINKKTSATEVGDNVIGKLEYYFRVSDAYKNGIKELTKRSDMKNADVIVASRNAAVRFNFYLNEARIMIDDTYYHKYQECISE